MDPVAMLLLGLLVVAIAVAGYVWAGYRADDREVMLAVSHRLQDAPYPITAPRIAKDIGAPLGRVWHALSVLEAQGWVTGWWTRSLSEPGGRAYVWVTTTKMRAP